jgi:wobble nucleotide-excising tRNase
MIKKFLYINNLAVFSDFDWDKEVIDNESKPLELKKTNILYGRNYSGKTTLSRIVRAMETGRLSDKYENPECSISIVGQDNITQNNFSSHNKIIRVFNEDFIKDNLKFIIDSDENIHPFAILGEDNNVIEKKIQDLKDKLGVNKENEETALYKELRDFQSNFNSAQCAHQTAKKDLDSQLREKAIGQPNGIKYNSGKFGDQNYNINKLRDDITKVKKDEFNPITNEEKEKLKALIREGAKAHIQDLPKLSLTFESFSTQTKGLVEKSISQSNKIENLVKNAILNNWVKEGRELHKDKLNTCAFCDNEIKASRWDELDRHFDEESKKLETEISGLITEIKHENNSLESIEIVTKDSFYSKYNDEFNRVKEAFDNSIKEYQKSLESLIQQLEKRKDNIINTQIFEAPNNVKSQIDTAVEAIETLRIKSNKYTENLSQDQNSAKEHLRLREVCDFIATIEYDNQEDNIFKLSDKLEKERAKKDNKQVEINNILSDISQRQTELNDEKAGAKKVNELLNNYFGHKFLSLEAIEFKNEDTGSKQYRFEIHRENKKAYHLSEGENSLIAFCYFMAKLQDTKTKGLKPIIWIDDPISSLDSNHIFFIYTLINTQISERDDFEQLFISTHNLNFLKYLKRLLNAHNDEKKKEEKKLYQYLIIERNENKSSIKIMPNYLRDSISEFNYLFSQIYKCSIIKNIDDNNYTTFYNFGNNARKFLELYLYYKYPDSTKLCDKMKIFFGDENIPTVFIDRLNNEYSHLSGTFERGESIIEVPEMSTVAKLIITKIEEKDPEQYKAFLNNINITPIQ